jgi:hypothetical protein
MGAYIGVGSGTLSAENNTQEELRKRWEVDYVDSVFKKFMDESFVPYIETISEIFTPPRSIGVHFYFANNLRKKFVDLVYSRAFPPPPVKSLSMRQQPANTPMVPDKPNDASASWRNIAAAKGIGTSFRSADTGLSLHVAFNKASCDIHVDRNGFIMKDAYGNVYWDLNGLLRHFTVDLLSDALPWILVSGGVLNKNRQPVIEATLSPWLAIDLPSRENGGQREIKFGILIGGKFDENKIIEYISH